MQLHPFNFLRVVKCAESGRAVEALSGLVCGTKERDEDVNTSHSLSELLRVSFPPPVFGEVVGHDENVLANQLMTPTAMTRKDALIAIADLIEHLRPHAVAVKLVHKKRRLVVVVVTPESGVLVGDLEVVSGARAEVRDELVGEAGLANSGGSDDTNDNRFEISGLRLESLVVAEGAAVLQPLIEMLIGNVNERGSSNDVLLDLGEVVSCSLLLSLALFPGAVESGVFLLRVLDRLLLGPSAGLEVSPFEAIVRLKLSNGALSTELNVALVVKIAVVTQLKLVREILRTRPLVHVKEGDLTVPVVERETPVTTLCSHG